MYNLCSINRQMNDLVHRQLGTVALEIPSGAAERVLFPGCVRRATKTKSTKRMSNLFLQYAADEFVYHISVKRTSIKFHLIRRKLMLIRFYSGTGKKKKETRVEQKCN